MRLLILTSLALALPVLAVPAFSQTDTPVTTNNGTPPSATAPASLPSAPAVPANPAEVLPGATLPSGDLQVQTLPNLLAPAPVIPANAPPLTLSQAEHLAILHNPRIALSRLLALAQGQVTREQRAAYFPTISGAATAVYAEDGTRITAGALNNPVLYQRAAIGATLNQMLTDFGRTRNLVASANLRTEAAQSNAIATRDDIVFAVDQAFYRALGAQALIEVATQTVKARTATSNQIQALTNARLRSTLDLNFANADLAQSQLLLLDARNQSATAQADLSALLGDDTGMAYRLIDETPAAPTAPPLDAAPLIQQAFAARPDLMSLKQQADAAHKAAIAERDLLFPTISALGATGDAPTRAPQITNDFYGAIGVNLSVPIFNGFLYTARANEAKLRASAADQQTQQLRDAIVRDVTTTVLQAQSNFNRIAVAEQLAQQSASALDLAQTRYKLGLSSIVELSQAQLLDTQASIQLANARYAYQGSLAAIRYQTGQ